MWPGTAAVYAWCLVIIVITTVRVQVLRNIDIYWGIIKSYEICYQNESASIYLELQLI